MLSVRVVTVDHYIARPIKYIKDTKSDGGHWIEPVIRIFGPTSDGTKTCVHIHGVYPYIYVPYRGGEDSERDALLLAAALDQALGVDSKSKNPRFVYKIILASGIPLYGYHSRPRQFFKIYFFNPHHIRKASDLLLSGAVLGQKFQPHEAHIPFTLQFMIDYNIYGMSFVTFDKCWYRRSPANPESLDGIDPSLLLPLNVKRGTYSYWEVDALAENILNYRSSGGSVSVNPGLEAIWEDERNRRRAQERTSQITPLASESRPQVEATSSELIHKQRLEQKLKDVVVQVSDATPESELTLSYPAELPENATDILEASVVGAGDSCLHLEELPENLGDLLDEEILTRVQRESEEVGEEEEVRFEDDSVLGRNHREEEEAEREEEDDDGGDMTQPLEEMLEKEMISGNFHADRDERGDQDSEEEFWKKMADRIMQLDGADDPSADGSFLTKTNDAVDKILGGTSPGSDSNWSNNIMSILNDGSGYQTGFWSGWSPKEPLWPGNGESWNWDKNDTALLDCLLRKTGKTVDDTPFEAPSHGDQYVPPPGQYVQGNYTPTSTMSPVGCSVSPPSAILTPLSEVDSYSDVNGDSVSIKSVSPSCEEVDHRIKTVVVPRVDVKKSPLAAEHKDVIELLRKFSQLRKSPEEADSRVKSISATLQQYIKTSGEIVNVDFKNLSGKDVIVVEYKPVNTKSNQNKYLIKPLDKFLEDWASSCGKPNNTEWPRLINGFSDSQDEEKQLTAMLNTLENKYTGTWLNESKIKSIKNRFVVKTMEMVPDAPEKAKNNSERSYKVNESVMSDGKIKMRLIKDVEKRSTRKKGNKLREKECKLSTGKEREREKEDSRAENTELISQINQSFEDYFKNIVKVNACSAKNEKVVEVEEDEDEDEDEDDDDEEEEEEDWTSGEDSDTEKSSDTIRFITQLLSALTSLPVPLSITINVGNGRISPSVQFNVRTAGGQQKRRRSKKLLVSNFDGPVDTSSSSEESLGDGKPTACTQTKKRIRKETGYRPLNVLLQKTSSERKRKLPKNLAEEIVVSESSPSVSWISDRGNSEGRDGAPGQIVRQERKRSSSGRVAEQEVTAQDLTRIRVGSGSSEQFLRLGTPVTSATEEEKDFIEDSEEECQGDKRKRRRLKKLLRRARKAIPQTDVVTSSDGEDYKGIVSFYDATTIDPESLQKSSQRSSENSSLFDLSVPTNALTVVGETTITPTAKAPRLTDTEGAPISLAPVARGPFYSNPRDITKCQEVGERLLRIENYSIAGLKTHLSDINIEGTEERRNRALNLQCGSRSVRSLLVGKNDITITPLKLAPTSKELLQWSQMEEPDGDGNAEEKEAARVKMPKSPGQDSDSDEMDLSVTVTPGETFNSKPKSAFKQKKQRDPEEPRALRERSQDIVGVTPDNTFGFKNSVECLQDAKAMPAYEHITMLVMEVHVQTRGNLRPDPQYDQIRALFYTLVTDGPNSREHSGMVTVGEEWNCRVPSLKTHHVADEKELMDKVVEFLRLWDPDILTGYEIETLSWGFLFQRSFVLEKNLFSVAGRIVEESHNWKDDAETSEEFEVPRFVRNMRITGRIVLDAWRILRHEIALTSYTFESVMYHILHERHPRHSFRDLSRFWQHHRLRHITVEYFQSRTEGIVRILRHLDFLSRNSELARLFGIQFFEVLSRGSQFRVESMMLRLAKPKNFVACSPSIQQRAAMRAPASLPLIMEPESMFYVDPVIVLDFQSLYPSMIIAYNYCFSTCLGRVENLGGTGPFEFGCTHLQVPPEELKSLMEDINISPAGVAFVKSNVRKGVLPSMLEEILETRLMVKKSMKENRGNKVLEKVLHARQLGLKLIANVTYGYTAANFSGRMPCIEVGDSVVSKGRETLQRAIELVKKTERWGAKVVYGDTDSMFVLTPGKTREEAFRIGSEIADAVTKDNPKPVKLKLEKVYQPSILQTKKRYVGYMYETPEQKTPVYDAKGIETVRRDGCPATAKILQKALQILFETRDVSQVKKYAILQFGKLFQGRVNTQDLIFAKEYRGRGGYRPGACVPALELAKRFTQADRRAEPRVKERVPYVIVNGPPGLPLIRLVRSPEEFFADPSLRINAAYYITKAIIPPLQRCFSLLGADVMSWFAEMPRRYHRVAKSTHQGEKRGTISQYFATVECAVCFTTTTSALCGRCQEERQKSAVLLHEKIRRLERNCDGISRICASCCGRIAPTDCESIDCPVLFRRRQASRELEEASALREICAAFLH